MYTVHILEMVKLGPARGPKRAGPENPGPRALRAETGLMIFLFKIPVCIVRWPLRSNNGIMYCYNLLMCCVLNKCT